MGWHERILKRLARRFLSFFGLKVTKERKAAPVELRDKAQTLLDAASSPPSSAALLNVLLEAVLEERRREAQAKAEEEAAASGDLFD